MSRKLPRRAVIRGIGAAGVLGLAGCTSDGEDGDGGDGADGGDGDDSGDGGGGTDTPTDESDTTEGDGEDGGSMDGGADRTIKHGVLMPLSGDLAPLGAPIRDGAILPAERLKDADIPVDIDYQVGDTQTSATAGVSAAGNLVNAGYPAVTGPAGSEVNLAVSRQVFIPNQVVGMSPSSTSVSVTALEDDDYIFRTAPSDALQGPVGAEVAASSLGASSAATLHLNNDYGQALSQAFSNAFENQHGGTIQAQVSFEAEQSSYTSVLSQALSGDPDLLYIVGYPKSGQVIFRDFYTNYSPDTYDIMVTDGLRDKELPADVGNPLENVFGTAPLSAGPQQEAFANQYQNAYDRAPGVFNGQAYDATAVVLLANAAAGENDGTAIRDNLRDVANPGGTEIGPENLAEGIRMAHNGEEIQYVGASSNVNFDENGDMTAVTYEVFEFGDDGIVTTETIEFGN